MIAAPSLGDIVKQHRDIQHAARDDLRKDLGRQRVIGGQIATFDPRQQADRPDGMLIDGIVMIHVELHLRDDTAEIGHEPAEDAGFIHPAEYHFRIARGCQDVQKQCVRAGIAAHAIRQLCVPGRGPQRQRVDLHAVQIGQLEYLDQPYRIFSEEAVVRQCQPSPIKHEAMQLRRTSPQARQPKSASPRRELVIDMGEEDSGQRPDRLRLQEIVLHEAFDRRLTRPVGVPHALRYFALHVERQAILCPPRDKMQVAAHRPEEIVGAVEQTIFVWRVQADVHELRRAIDVKDVLADPEERVEIAQPPLPFLDVRLHDIARVAHLHMAGISFDQLVRNELTLGAVRHLGLEARHRLFVEVGVAPNISPLQKGSTDGHIGFRLTHHLVERPRGMADLQAHVPQAVEHGFDHLLRPGRLLPWRQEPDIDVGKRRHLAATISADGDEHEALGRGGVAEREHALRDQIVQQLQQLIDQECLCIGRFQAPRRPVDQALRDLRPSGFQRFLEQCRRRAAKLPRVVDIDCRQFFGDHPAIDDRAAIGQRVKA